MLVSGGKEGTSRDMMAEALQRKNKDYVEHVNYFCPTYWGWRRPSVQGQRSNIMFNHQKIISAMVMYNILQKYGRKTIINRQIMLYKHLQILKVPCNIEDFRIVGTSTVFGVHLAVWETACVHAGLPAIPAM